MGTSWRSVHATVDGVLLDRDNATTGLVLEMRPIGTELPKAEQTRELWIWVGERTNLEDAAILDEEGIQALAAFLKERP